MLALSESGFGCSLSAAAQNDQTTTNDSIELVPPRILVSAMVDVILIYQPVRKRERFREVALLTKNGVKAVAD